jgi:hypothetical protein
MLNNTKIQNPKEQEMVTYNNVIAMSPNSAGDQAMRRILNLRHLKFELV